MISIRQQSIQSLNTVYKGDDHNKLEQIENSVYNLSGDSDYKYNIYQISCDILHDMSLDTIITNIRNGAIGWNHNMFFEISQKLNEQDDFILNPFEVAEGVLQCTRCGGSRTLSYSRQVRSCDEGTSVYASCMECKNSWVHSG